MRRFRRPDGRIYEIAEPRLDLLGDEVIATYHGSRHSRRGGIHIYLAGRVSIETLVRLRLAHGYVELRQQAT